MFQANFTITDAGPVSWTAPEDCVLVGGFALGVPTALISLDPDLTYAAFAEQFNHPSQSADNFFLAVGSGNMFGNVFGWNFRIPKDQTIFVTLDQNAGFVSLFFENAS